MFRPSTQTLLILFALVDGAKSSSSGSGVEISVRHKSILEFWFLDKFKRLCSSLRLIHYRGALKHVQNCGNQRMGSSNN